MIKVTKTRAFCVLIFILFFVMQIFIHKYSIKAEIKKENMGIQCIDKIKNLEGFGKTEIWQIEIPNISLKVNILEGAIWHCENTSKEQGNVVLLMNNRDLKLLKEGDEIKYTHNKFEKIYEVEKNRIIKDTERDYLEETEENILTLITCVENQTEFRRCIQAIEKEEIK